ncbi:M-phase inducer phosphatase 3 isoform X1 [Molossus molossus]|uniref:M-phase inducer phosphatase 3 isoform X1 n=1 Tax=Molossus molossus TaxID=27622 RepID=UPI001747AD56|nr:M-phase inducer phosphatase 3 isoform X1 [Molossus molossus]XP_036095585.1 M-phase inducer phosphatase 3 isoform X1 [Molossus molossus]
MSAEFILSTREEGSPGTGPSFRSHQRKILNLLLERDSSFTIYPDLPRTPVDKLFGDSVNLSILSGGTPKHCLDLSNLSSGEMSATQLTTPANLDGTGPLDSSGPQEIQLAQRNHHQHHIRCSPAQLLCSTPKALGHGNKKKDAMCSSSTNKENENSTLKSLKWCVPRNLKFQKKSERSYMSPLSLLVSHWTSSSRDNGNLVESEMKYLGSPIQRLDKTLTLGKDQLEEISDELMDFSLEDQKETKGLGLKRVSLCDINTTQILEEGSNPGCLTGDFSKVCALPTVSGRHQDLKYINPETVSRFLEMVAALLSGKYQGLIEKFYIIDCRYPYEYLGGHIQGALNLYSQEKLYNFFLKTPIVPLDTQKRIIIVFHCEFSSERGPRLCRSLREEDRALNQYPALYYPELYILKGGYRDFFPEYMVLCEPQSYCPMHHQDHMAELLRCRSQNKAWEGKRQLQEQIALMVKEKSPQ